MSIEKNINSRIVHKHDIEANWIKAINFIPKQGEIIIYDADDNYSYPRFKIGDGLTLVNNLPFVIIQSDQNQNDETAIDFIKNRLAYTIPGEYELISDDDVVFIQYDKDGQKLYATELTPIQGNWIDYNMSSGVLMQLMINDRLIHFVTKTNSEIPNCIYGGNPKFSQFDPIDTGEDFFIQAGLDTPQDPIGFCVLVLTDLEPADSYHVSLKAVIKPDTYKKLDPKYYDRLAWTENESYKSLLLTRTINPTTTDEKIYSFEIQKVLPFFAVGHYYSIQLNDIEHILYCYSDNCIGNPYLLAPTDGIYTDDPLVLTFIELNDNAGYALYGKYLKEIFPYTDSITISIKEYIPEEVKKIDHKYYDNNGYFNILWEKPPITFIGAQTMEQHGITLHGGLIPFVTTLGMNSNIDLKLPIYVNFDDTDYKCSFSLDLPLIGNQYLYDSTLPNTEEPFLIILNNDIIVIVVLDQEEHTISFGQRIPHKIHKDLVDIPLATSTTIGGILPEAKTEVDVQPVTIDENGKLWTEPTSNTVVRDDDNGNVVLISLATQNHENIVTDDGDGNVEVQSTSMYNPFPGIENAEIGQTVEIAEVDINGFPTKWNAVDAGANGNIFIVTVENDPITGQLMASATPAEILEQVMQNKIIFMPMEGLSCNLVECTGTQAAFIAMVPSVEELFFGMVIIAEDKTITIDDDTIDFTQFITISQYNQDKTLLINELNNKITRPENAEVGQVLSVKTVNANGVPTAWEAITLSSGGASTTNIPTPTMADAGKFLRVSAEGLYILENMTNAMEVSF